MTTTNQKIVSEALHLARTLDFATGLRFLTSNAPASWKNRDLTDWFANKCDEHKITRPHGFTAEVVRRLSDEK